MREAFIWPFQIIAAVILLFAGCLKVAGGETDIFIFTTLGMEPFGRFLIGFLELLAGVCLLSRNFSVGGAVLGMGIMMGAILAHSFFLGISIDGDGGRHIPFLVFALLSCCIVTFFRRKQLPIIGDLF